MPRSSLDTRVSAYLTGQCYLAGALCRVPMENNVSGFDRLARIAENCPHLMRILEVPIDIADDSRHSAALLTLADVLQAIVKIHPADSDAVFGVVCVELHPQLIGVRILVEECRNLVDQLCNFVTHGGRARTRTEYLCGLILRDCLELERHDSSFV